jgi:prepilin-type N-terminal cleavage/methylation domain-containing protein
MGASRDPARPRARRADRGLTLVEVVVALAMLVLAGMIATGAVTMATRANAFARERMIALAAAEAQMERLLVLGNLADLTALDGTLFAVPGLVSSVAGSAAGTVTIGLLEAPLVTIEVRVRWKGLEGDADILLRSAVLIGGGP